MDDFKDFSNPFKMDKTFSSGEPVPFNHWKRDNYWVVKFKSYFGYYFVEVEALSPEEAVAKASNLTGELTDE